MDITISKETAMKAVFKCRIWDAWMINWVHWDFDEQTYIGASPDEEEICRGIDPTRFLQDFQEASAAWVERNEPT